MKTYFSNLLVISLLFSFFVNSEINHNNFVKNPKIIIFDIEKTLINIQYIKSAYEHFGLVSSFKGLLQGDLDVFFEKYLMQVPCFIVTSKLRIAENHEINNLNGKKISPLEYNYLTGKLNSEQCIKSIETAINDKFLKFENEFQKDLFKKMANFYFKPEIFLKYNNYTKMIDLMKEVFEIKEKDGKRKNIVIVFANQSKQSLEEIKKTFGNIFKFSDEQFISCNEKSLMDLKLLRKALDLCPKLSYYKIFHITGSTNIFNKKFIINNHSVENVNVNDAEKVLNAFGVTDKNI